MTSLLNFLKEVRHLIETALVYILFTGFRFVPVEYTSKVMGFVVKNLFYIHKADKIMKKNIALSFKAKTSEEIDDIADKVWENIGMSFAEFPYFARISETDFNKRVEIVGLKNIENLTKQQKPFIMFSAHFSNWEVIYKMFKFKNLKGSLFYRPNSNKWLDRYTIKMRETKNYRMQPKGQKGLKAAMDVLQQGGSLATFIDQKLNEGIAVPFLGRKAMTPPLMANLALKYNYPLIPIHVERVGIAKYKLIIESPLLYKEGKDKKETIYNIMKKANQCLDKWIRKNPEQWFWVHNRWPK